MGFTHRTCVIFLEKCPTYSSSLLHQNHFYHFACVVLCSVFIIIFFNGFLLRCLTWLDRLLRHQLFLSVWIFIFSANVIFAVTLIRKHTVELSYFKFMNIFLRGPGCVLFQYLQREPWKKMKIPVLSNRMFFKYQLDSNIVDRTSELSVTLPLFNILLPWVTNISLLFK